MSGVSTKAALQALCESIGQAITIGLSQVRSPDDPLWAVLELLAQARDQVEAQRAYDPQERMRALVEASEARRGIKTPQPAGESAQMGANSPNLAQNGQFTGAPAAVTAPGAPAEGATQHDTDTASGATGAQQAPAAGSTGTSLPRDFSIGF